MAGSGKQFEHAAAEYFGAVIRHVQDGRFAGHLRPFERFESTARIRRPCFDNSAACSNSETHALMSSVSIAFVPSVRMYYATRAFTAAGTFGSTASFNSVVTAAPDACRSRAVRSNIEKRKSGRRA